MKKTTILVLSILIGVITQATELQLMTADNVMGNQNYETMINGMETLTPTQDNFQKLLDLAHQSQSISFSNAKGLYTGRCYDKLSRNHVGNSALLITQLDTNDGPIFPTEKVVIEGGDTSSAEALDSISKEVLTSALIDLKSRFASVIENPLSVILNTSTDSEPKLNLIKFFTSQNYIIGLAIANQEATFNVRWTGKPLTVKKDQIWAACYYFNKK